MKWNARLLRLSHTKGTGLCGSCLRVCASEARAYGPSLYTSSCTATSAPPQVEAGSEGLGVTQGRAFVGPVERHNIPAIRAPHHFQVPS
ncbi:hypothetical protein GY45DRAFT_593209 [Cubamyces sp. BRFM 1775]|nr:hypothetical protein GY45DRAFT_593209 [Cubamyces sp. BRFM 1775]